VATARKWLPSLLPSAKAVMKMPVGSTSAPMLLTRAAHSRGWFGLTRASSQTIK
jgi:hypothetical protein